jgi:hypothetical protein
MIDPGQRLQILVVEVPSAGSPKVARDVKPPRYPQQRREHWTGPPRRLSKGAAVMEFQRRINQQDALVRQLLKPDPSALKAWLHGAP